MRTFLAIIILLTLGGCEQEPVDVGIQTIVKGFIKDGNSQPLPGYDFEIRGGGKTYSFQSNQSGYFEYSFRATVSNHMIFSKEPGYVTFWDGRIQSDTINVKSLYACPAGYVKSKFYNYPNIDTDSMRYSIDMSAGCLSPYVLPVHRDHLFGGSIILALPHMFFEPYTVAAPSSGYTRFVTKRYLAGSLIDEVRDSVWVTPGDTLTYNVIY